MNQIERQFIRHPSEIPLEYCISKVPPVCNIDVTSNVSQGGLRFHSTRYIEPNQWLHLYIPINDQFFETDAQVCWCKPTEQTDEDKESYDVGVSFCNSVEAFSARMIEQVCHIEEYKKFIWQEEGRNLSDNQAATEWIQKYADRFPSVTL